MALPTLPAYWSTRYKNVRERTMVQKREHEADQREKWGENAQYFQKSDVRTSKQNAWSSDRSFQDSMNAYSSRDQKERKAMRLKKRQDKLKQLLADEKDQHEAEIRGLSFDNFSRMESMKERSEGLKTSRETNRKKIADERMYEHWKQNNPDLRKIEQEHHKKHVIKGWGTQVDEQHERLASAREEQRRYEEQEELERQAALEEDRMKQQSRLDDDKAMARALKDQVGELKAREEEAERLKAEQDSLQQQQWDIEKLEEERRDLETQRKKSEMGRVLKRQYKAQLRRKAQQVQEALELDFKILEALAAKAEDDKQVQTARQEKAKADAVWMKQVVEEQLKLERAREAELDMLYQDEAARQWQKREAEWERERIARERLMAQVLEGRQDQIQKHMETNRLRQEESLQRREELLRELEVVQQMTARDKVEEERKKVETKRELEAQITSRQERIGASHLLQQQELQAEAAAEREYEEMLRQEASRISLNDFEPKSYPRTRKSAWD